MQMKRIKIPHPQNKYSIDDCIFRQLLISELIKFTYCLFKELGIFK